MLDWVLCNRGWEVGDGGGDGGPIDVEEAYYVCRIGLSSGCSVYRGKIWGASGTTAHAKGYGGC